MKIYFYMIIEGVPVLLFTREVEDINLDALGTIKETLDREVKRVFKPLKDYNGDSQGGYYYTTKKLHKQNT